MKKLTITIAVLSILVIGVFGTVAASPNSNPYLDWQYIKDKVDAIWGNQTDSDYGLEEIDNEIEALSEDVSELSGRIENTPQIETGGGVLTNIIDATVPFNEEGDQVQHVSLTVAGHHLGMDTQVQVNIDYDYGAGFGPSIVIFKDESMPRVKTIEFNAIHWELGVYDAVINPTGPDTTIFYEYTITYPPAD